jgi:hypothetical protein
MQHLACTTCWSKQNGKQPGSRFTDVAPMPCCFCGDQTTTGVFVVTNARDPNERIRPRCHDDGPVHGQESEHTADAAQGAARLPTTTTRA